MSNIIIAIKKDMFKGFNKYKVIDFFIKNLWDGCFPVGIDKTIYIVKDREKIKIKFDYRDLKENSLCLAYRREGKEINIQINKKESKERQHYAYFYGLILVLCDFIDFDKKDKIYIYDFNQGDKAWNNLRVANLVDKIVVPKMFLKTVFKKHKKVQDMAKFYGVSVTVLYRRLKQERIL